MNGYIMAKVVHGKNSPSEYLLFGDECHTLYLDSGSVCLFVSAASVQKNLMFMYRKRSPRFILVLGPFLGGFLMWISGCFGFFGCGFGWKRFLLVWD